MEESRNEPQKSRRGFAAMSPDRQREIARQGGRAAHQQGVAHEWSKEEARAAGKKGGQISGTKRNPLRNGSPDMSV
jgi:general stress protein YciG